MQSVAAQINHSETAFLVQEKGNKTTTPYFKIRYFTPTTEVPLCGHATLASAYVLAKDNHLSEQEQGYKIRFTAKGGELEAEVQGHNIQLKFPKYRCQKIDHMDPLILNNLGLSPINIYESEQAFIYELDSESAINSYTPNIQAMIPLNPCLHIITAKSDRSFMDYTARVFAPCYGVNEDPVTGLAHCILGPLWAKKLGQESLMAHQASKRGGVLGVAVLASSVTLSGKAVIVVRGEWLNT